LLLFFKLKKYYLFPKSKATKLKHKSYSFLYSDIIYTYFSIIRFIMWLISDAPFHFGEWLFLLRQSPLGRTIEINWRASAYSRTKLNSAFYSHKFPKDIICPFMSFQFLVLNRWHKHRWINFWNNLKHYYNGSWH